MDRIKASSIFKKQKEDPQFLAVQGQRRLYLLKNLARAIKETQLVHANQEEGEERGRPIGDCRAVQRLCARFEDCLRHGLKASWFGGSSLWAVVLLVSRKQAIEYIKSLQYAQTDNGKCRAWIRLAVNECSLESYTAVICQDAVLLSQYYEPYSFVRDKEMADAMKQLLTGLSEVAFNISVDTASLEFEAVPEALQPVTALRLQPRQQGAGEAGRESKPLPAHRHRGSSHKELRHGSVRVEDSSDSEWSEREESSVRSHDGIRITSGPQDMLPLSTISDSIPKESSVEHLESSTYNTSSNSPEVQSNDSWRGGREEDGERGKEWGAEKEEGTGGWNGFGEEEGLYGGIESAVDSGYPVVTTEGDGGRMEVTQSSKPDSFWNGSDGEQALESSGDRGQSFAFESVSVGVFGQNVSSSDGLDDSIPRLNPFGLSTAIPSPPATQGTPPVDNEYPPSGVQETDWTASGHTPIGTGPQRSPSPHPEKVQEASPCPSPPLTSSNSESSGPHPPVLCHPEPSNPTHSSTGPSNHAHSSTGPSNPAHSSTGPSNHAHSSTNPFDYPEVVGGSGRLGPGPPSFSANCSPLSSPRHLDSEFPQASSFTNDHLQPRPNPYDTPSSGLSSTTDSTSDLAEELLPHLVLQADLDSSLFSSSLTSSLNHSILEEVLGRTGDCSRTHAPLGMGVANNETTPTEAKDSLEIHEDYFAPEMSVVGLRGSIEHLKLKLPSVSDETEKKDILRRIVQLQFKLQRLKEEKISEPFQSISGHRFVRQPFQASVVKGVVCEGCGKQVRGLIRSWYTCKVCSCACHKSCLPRLSKLCVATKEEEGYHLELCPEKGMTRQQFRCTSCNRAIYENARLCDYSGLYYCTECHQNDLAVIPARVLHNWDFTPRTVCAHCASLLRRLSPKPLVKVHRVNSLLYSYVQDLVTIESLRGDIICMKKYFKQCTAAMESNLLQQLDRYPHFRDHSRLFSLEDLAEVQSGQLLPLLQDIHRAFVRHVKEDCPTCSGKGFCCELCESEEVLYPFDHHASSCKKCHSVFHKSCFTGSASCPKCDRLDSKVAAAT